MNRTKRFFLCFFLALAAASVFAADDELVSRYLNAANEQYSAGYYSKAFSYINNVLGSYKDAELPQNVEVLAETVYYAYLGEIKDSRNSAAFNAVKEKLIEFPTLSSDRIARLVKIINTHEAQDVAWGADPARPQASASGGASPSVGNNNPVLYKTLELQLALEGAKQQASTETQQQNDAYQKQLLDTQKDAYEKALAATSEATGTNNRLLLLGLLVLAGVCFIVFIVVIINLIVNLKSSKNQNEKFVETLKVVSELARAPVGMHQLEALPPFYGADGNVKMIGSATKETGLPPPPANEAEEKELSDLALKCRELGARIDQATGRKNNSKNVAEMVYKISLEMGVTDQDAMLLFAVAMVYDIGFLEIDSSLLQAEHLTDGQKYEIRNHVKQGLAQISFVPEKYVPIFADGIQMHHENMDGTGYPEGLSGNRIPYIARLIRVAESFVALISRRNYRDIFDKESALEELRKKPGIYDPAIVDVLERII
jgi:HD-GYP domain-containing protein (c-di-GMP phosphodiesterase class II)